MNDFIIRDMLPEDADGKGAVHYWSWQESYRGIVDQGYLNAMSEEKCRAMARRWPENTAVAVADGGEVVGFVNWTESARGDGQPEGTGELCAIYILEAYKRRGIGRALADYAMERLAKCRQVIVWVLKENASAISFYRHYGFVRTGKELLLTIGAPATCICMAKKI